MAHGNEKLTEDTEELGLAEKYLGMGRINHTGVWKLIKGIDTGGFSVLVGDVGDDPPHGMGPGEVPE